MRYAILSLLLLLPLAMGLGGFGKAANPLDKMRVVGFVGQRCAEGELFSAQFQTPEVGWFPLPVQPGQDEGYAFAKGLNVSFRACCTVGTESLCAEAEQGPIEVPLARIYRMDGVEIPAQYVAAWNQANVTPPAGP